MVPRLEKKCSSCLKALYKYIPSLLWLLRLLWVIFLATFELECLISEHDELLQYWTFWTKKLQRAWGTTTNSPTDPAQWIDETVLERYIYIYIMFKCSNHWRSLIRTAWKRPSHNLHNWGKYKETKMLSSHWCVSSRQNSLSTDICNLFTAKVSEKWEDACRFGCGQTAA